MNAEVREFLNEILIKCHICKYENRRIDVDWNTRAKKKFVHGKKRTNKRDRDRYEPELVLMMEWTTCNRCGAVLKLDVRELSKDFDCILCPMVHFKDKSNYMCLLENNCFFISPSKAVGEWHGMLSGNMEVLV